MQWMDTLEAYPAWQRYLVIALIYIAVVGAFYFLKYDKSVQEIEKLDVRMQELDAKINKGLAMKDKLEEFRKEVFQLKERMRLAAEVLGNRPNVDLLVKSMENLATQSGLKVEKFQPLNERNKGFYGEIPISLSIFGSYHELGMFFDKISNETRIMNVSDLQISSQSSYPGETIMATCLLTAFWSTAR